MFDSAFTVMAVVAALVLGEVLLRVVFGGPRSAALRSLHRYVREHRWPTIAAWVVYLLAAWLAWPHLSSSNGAVSAFAVLVFVLGVLFPIHVSRIHLLGRKGEADWLPTAPNKR